MNVSPDPPREFSPFGETGAARSYSPLGIAAILFGLVNLSFVPMMVSIRGPNDGAIFLATLAAGPLVAQFGILPAWLVWGDGPFWKRLVIHWSLAIGLSLAWLCGIMLGMAGDNPIGPPEFVFRDLAMGFLCLPAVSLGIEAPLWLTRIILGWRISRHGASPDAPRPLAISDFLWGMAVISAALAAVRGAGALGGQSTDDEDVWIAIAIAIGSAAAVSLLVMPLCAWCLLGTKNVGNGLAVIVVYTIILGFVIVGTIVWLSGPPPSGEPLAALILFVASASASIGGSLALARGAGYRLKRGRESAEGLAGV